MEEKKAIKINLKTVIFIILLVILIIVVCVYCFTKKDDKNTNELNVNNELENEISEDLIANVVEKNEVKNETVTEEISEDTSNTDVEIEEYDINSLLDISYPFDFYNKAIDEFDSIKSASQEYLFGVATNSLVRNRDDKDVYNLRYEDFNEELVRIFGKEADQLLKKEYISTDEFDYDPETGIYSIIGRGLAESDIKTFLISDISQNENDYAVTIYEYIWKSVDSNGWLTPSFDAKNIDIYSVDGERLIRFDVKKETEFDGQYEYIITKLYDSENNLVEDEHQYLKEHLNILKDKRVINVKYDEEEGRYIVVSNKIVK